MLKDEELNLLSKLNRGDERAFSQLYSCYWEDVFNYTLNILRDQSESEDIVQETFLELWRLRERLSHVNSLKAYLITIARNKAFHLINNKANNQQYIDAIVEFAEKTTNSPADLYIAKELSTIVDQEVVKLPPKMRHVFVLSRTENLSYKEISEELRLSDKTVKKQINNSIKFLRKRLKYHYNAQLIYLIILFSTT
jgi:RNA polymerase sigma-70 factor (ECF subfamily)